ncbi:MAG: thioredoxin fold domain-containing protein [Gammaproteobacteria bacterium]|nr:thioredoxin fold domain-containing protein [Gammaproteobacteria bacterium]
MQSKFIRLFVVLNSLLFTLGSTVHAEESIGADLVNPGYVEKPAWFKNSFLDIREDIAEAASDNKRVMLYFHQDGCPYCARLIQDNFSQHSIVKKSKKYFDVIAINMWGDREVTDLNGNLITEKAFSRSARVMYTPTLLLLNEKGQIALRINGYYAPHKFEAALDYVGQHMETQLSFREYFKQQSPVKASGKLHQEPFYVKAPLNLSQLIKDSKPLLLLFEQKQCPACDELHGDIFKRKKTQEQLQRFNVVQLDMWSNEKIINSSGEEISIKQLAADMNIQYAPSMIFMNQQGTEIFRAEAYIKSFHTQSVMDYVASGAYKTQPEFQRYISERADKLEAQGIHVDIWD